MRYRGNRTCPFPHVDCIFRNHTLIRAGCHPLDFHRKPDNHNETPQGSDGQDTGHNPLLCEHLCLCLSYPSSERGHKQCRRIQPVRHLCRCRGGNNRASGCFALYGKDPSHHLDHIHRLRLLRKIHSGNAQDGEVLNQKNRTLAVPFQRRSVRTDPHGQCAIHIPVRIVRGPAGPHRSRKVLCRHLLFAYL